jgi:ABC-type sugar transport system permease subunit
MKNLPLPRLSLSFIFDPGNSSPEGIMDGRGKGIRSQMLALFFYSKTKNPRRYAYASAVALLVVCTL